MDYTLITLNKKIYCFDKSYNIFKIKEINSEIKDSLNWFNEEIELINELKGSNIYYIGYKKDKFSKVICELDTFRLKEILKKNKEIFDNLRTDTLKKTSEDINRELNDKSNKIIKSISIIEDINDSLKSISRRIYEEADYYNPELLFDKSENEIDYEKLLEDVLKNKTKNIGAKINDIDNEHIQNILDEFKSIKNIKEREELYLENIMTEFCPNLKKICASKLGAKLIKKAGSLKALAFMPSSLIQILGAEKALFRHIKKDSSPPKHGIIINHPIILNAEEKGKASRLLASKISLCAKTDYFSKGKIIETDFNEEIKKKLKKLQIKKMIQQ